MNLTEILAVLEKHMEDLPIKDRRKAERIIENTSGSYPDDEELEYLQSLALPFCN